MKTRLRIQSRNLWVVALPLFVAAGCAGNKQSVALNGGLQTDVIGIDAAQTDPVDADTVKTDTAQLDTVQQDDAVQTAIATMDGYVAGLEQAAEGRQSDEITTAVEESVAATEAVIAEAEAQPDDAAPPPAVIVAASEDTPSDTDTAANPAEDDPHEGKVASVPEERGILSVPSQLVFYFDTNSNMPAASDNDMLSQHAEYLRQHPDMVLMIRGHSDSRGLKAYNQRLSEQRAINVAEILLADGVSGEQLRIDGMGDDVPMADQSHWKQNRRVEFTYMDSMVARNN
ncbi:MAG: OmpA family protein [Gammaproteobacteria bacterium]|nr:OmpA family protein [Gammaproteobacteria bacterium]